MSKRTTMAIGILALTVLLFRGVAPTDAKGQGTSFRLLSSFAVLVGNDVYVLDPYNPPVGWHRLPTATETLPPVPPTSLLSFESGFAVTDTGEGWVNMGVGGWQSFGTVPGVVSVQRSSWGALKNKFR